MTDIIATALVPSLMLLMYLVTWVLPRALARKMVRFWRGAVICVLASTVMMAAMLLLAIQSPHVLSEGQFDFEILIAIFALFVLSSVGSITMFHYGLNNPPKDQK